jgi:hypothetical protein
VWSQSIKFSSFVWTGSTRSAQLSASRPSCPSRWRWIYLGTNVSMPWLSLYSNCHCLSSIHFWDCNSESVHILIKAIQHRHTQNFSVGRADFFFGSGADPEAIYNWYLSLKIVLWKSCQTLRVDIWLRYRGKWKVTEKNICIPISFYYIFQYSNVLVISLFW